MANTDAFDDRRRAQEEGYFRKKEQELVERMRQRAAADAERAGMAEVSGVADVEVLQRLQELGFNRETILLLHLVPLIHVAWIDGSVSTREREPILQIAATRGIVEGSPAYPQLVSWLERRPSEDFFEETTRVIKLIMQGESNEGFTPHNLVELCTHVAGASRGILGFGRKVSEEERALLEQLATTFAESKPDASQQVVDEVD